MLSNRLAELGARELTVREVDEGPPVRVFYRFTEAGTTLEPTLSALSQWAETYLLEGDQ